MGMIEHQQSTAWRVSMWTSHLHGCLTHTHTHTLCRSLTRTKHVHIFYLWTALGHNLRFMWSNSIGQLEIQIYIYIYIFLTCEPQMYCFENQVFYCFKLTVIQCGRKLFCLCFQGRLQHRYNPFHYRNSLSLLLCSVWKPQNHSPSSFFLEIDLKQSLGSYFAATTVKKWSVPVAIKVGLVTLKLPIV